MARKQLDPEDLVGIALLGYFGPMALGVASFSINLFGGFDFTSVLWSGAGAEITWAGVLALVGVGEIVLTNFWMGDWELSDMEPYLAVPIAVAFAVIPLYMFVPVVGELVADYDALALVLALVQVGIGPLLSWEG